MQKAHRQNYSSVSEQQWPTAMTRSESAFNKSKLIQKYQCKFSRVRGFFSAHTCILSYFELLLKPGRDFL